MKYLWLTITILLFWSCSPAERDIYRYASSESMLVVCADPATAIKNLGCSIDKDGVSLSPKMHFIFNMLMRKDVADNAVEAMRLQGLALDDALLVTNGTGENIVVMRLTDRTAFISWFEGVAESYKMQIAKSSQGQWQIYAIDSRQWVAVGQAEAIWVQTGRGGMDAVEIIEKFADASAKAPLLPWQMQSLDKGSLANAIINLAKLDDASRDRLGNRLFDAPQLTMGYSPQDLAEGYCTINSSLDGLSWSTSYRLVDASGKDLPYKYIDDKVDTSLLQFASSGDYAVSLATVPADVDWTGAIAQFRQAVGSACGIWLDNGLAQLCSFIMSKADGSAMVAGRPKSLAGIDALSGWDFALAMTLKKDNAASCLQELQDYCSGNNIKCTLSGNALVMQLASIGEISATVKADFLVISNQPSDVTKSNQLDKSAFQNKCSAFVLDVPKDNVASPLLRLPFGFCLTVDFDGKSLNSQLRLTDTQGNLLQNILDIF